MPVHEEIPMSAVLSPSKTISRATARSRKLRIPPHSVEAESSVLGGLLLDNGAWDRVGDLLVDGDFYRYEHKLIYAAIGALINASRRPTSSRSSSSCRAWARPRKSAGWST
jgi:replicative DNA helicase